MAEAPARAATLEPVPDALYPASQPASPAPWPAVHLSYDGAFARAGLFLAFAVAILARFYRLGDIPLGLHPAEEAFRQTASAVIHQGWAGLWSEATLGQPVGFAYWLAGLTYVLGDSLAAVRLLSAWVGLATLGMFYLFCRSLFGTRAALLGSMLLALCTWHLGYSRLALPVTSLLLLELVTLYLLMLAFGERGATTRRKRLFVLAGLSFGTAAYTHNAFFIFAVVVIALWVRELLSGRHPLAALSRSSLMFFITALIVALPYLASLAGSWGQVVDEVRAIDVSSSPGYQDVRGVTEHTRYILGNVGGTAMALLWRPGMAEGEEGSGRRILDPATALLAVLGLAVALYGWRERRHALILIIAAMVVVAVGLTREPGMYGRLIVALPAVFAAAGVALDRVLVWMTGRVPRSNVYAVYAVLVAFVAVYNLLSYFGSPVGPGDGLWAQAAGHEGPAGLASNIR